MTANILMLLGAVVWLTGELLGFFTDSPHSPPDTTSGWVWFLQKRHPILRWVIGIFTLSLFAHLAFGTWLLP